MDAQATAEILRHMCEIPDIRRPNRLHLLGDVITIAIFAVICGADGWVEVAEYGRRKFDWLKTFLALPDGIPSHDTFGRVLAKLDPAEFERCFMAWMSSLVELGGGKLVAIDGKSLRQSVEHDYHVEVTGDHGRIETGRVWVCWNVADLGPIAKDWPGLTSLVVVQSLREVNGKTSMERHDDIRSLGRRLRAKRMAGYVRGHGSVENNLHGQLDISFSEDRRRIRKDHGTENFSRLCRIALNLLKNEDSLKIGIAGKRTTCGWDNKYMLQVVGQ